MEIELIIEYPILDFCVLTVINKRTLGVQIIERREGSNPSKNTGVNRLLTSTYRCITFRDVYEP
jgi:hypothetical protein